MSGSGPDRVEMNPNSIKRLPISEGSGRSVLAEAEDRCQATRSPSDLTLHDDVTDDNPVRVIEASIDELDLGASGSSPGSSRQGARPVGSIILRCRRRSISTTILPHPSSCRLERETEATSS